MKHLILILIIGFSQTIQSQSTNDEKVFIDIINGVSYSENNTEIGYFKKVDSNMLSYSIKIFENHTSRTYKMLQKKTGLIDSIHLSSSEKNI